MFRMIFAILLIPSICFGANYYVDPTYNGSKGSSIGSYSRPWTKIEQVNSHSFSTGDDVYFRAGTALVMTERLLIDWSGSEKDRVEIGAYSAEETFTLGGRARPILDGNNWTVPTQGSYQGLIQHKNRTGYITIENLELKNSGARAISLGNSSDVTSYYNTYHIVRNCYLNSPWRNGIVSERCSYNLYEDNIVANSSTGHNKPDRITGASIEITGQHIESSSVHNVVKGNTVYNAVYEGIGVYKQARYTIIEYNTVYDCAVNIYVDRSRNQTIRNNLVYSTPDANRGANLTRNIVLEQEYGGINPYKFEVPTGGNEVYGNYIAGGTVGIELSVYDDVKTYGQRDNLIYDNILVDNKDNFRFDNTSNGKWSGNQYSDNFSFIYAIGGKHTDNNSPTGVIWNGNYYKENPTVTGNASNNQRTTPVDLQKTTGWRNLQPGNVNRYFFNLVGESIEAKPNIVMNVQIKES